VQNISSGEDDLEDELEIKMELSYKQRQDDRRSQRPESSSTYAGGNASAALNNISIARLRSAQMRPSDLKPFSGGQLMSLNHA
jgi:hypothetical protein